MPRTRRTLRLGAVCALLSSSSGFICRGPLTHAASSRQVGASTGRGATMRHGGGYAKDDVKARRRLRDMSEPPLTVTSGPPLKSPAYVPAICAGALVASTVVFPSGVHAVDGTSMQHLSGMPEVHIGGYDVGLMLQQAVDQIQAMGPMGYLYFFLLYVVAEVLIVPATPLTASSGYLFGLVGGVSIVLAAATVAAGVSFVLGRTLLKEPISKILEDNPRFKAVDGVLEREGFKIILLLRLSPLFPFAISNYLYGLTSVKFEEYIVATLLGFLPGTLLYVYSGMVGASLIEGGTATPSWVYAIALGLTAIVIKAIGQAATSAIERMEREDTTKKL